MAGIIKAFVKQKKLDMKFNKAGEGHKLNEEKKPVQQPLIVQQQQRKPQSVAAKDAGTAALERQQSGGDKPTVVKPKLAMSSDPVTDKPLFSGTGFRLNDSKRATDLPKPVSTLSSQQESSELEVPQVVTAPFSSVQVLMVCPMCSSSVAHSHIPTHLRDCLHEEYLKEPLTASVQMIHTLAESEERKATCVNTLLRYIDNVLSHPGEEKYRKIRASNKAFKERVESVTGGVLFLEAIGFTQQALPHEGGEEQFYVLSEAKASCSDDLMAWKEILTTMEKLVPTLDRNPQLLIPAGNTEHFDLPDDFYNLSIDEIRKEQKLRSDAVEQASVLRTKAMREKDELKSAIKYYRFILIRIRFPEDVILQGVFKPMEPLGAVREFISDCLLDPSRQYRLSFMRTQLIEDTNRLAQLGLAPAAVLSLQWVGEESFGFPVEQIFTPAVYDTLK